jgi:hypothetical protein
LARRPAAGCNLAPDFDTTTINFGPLFSTFTPAGAAAFFDLAVTTGNRSAAFCATFDGGVTVSGRLDNGVDFGVNLNLAWLDPVAGAGPTTGDGVTGALSGFGVDEAGLEDLGMVASRVPESTISSGLDVFSGEVLDAVGMVVGRVPESKISSGSDVLSSEVSDA